MGLNKLNHNFNEPLVSSSEATGSLVAGSATVQGAVTSNSVITTSATAIDLTTTNLTANNARISSSTLTTTSINGGAITGATLNSATLTTSFEKMFVTSYTLDNYYINTYGTADLSLVNTAYGNIWYYKGNTTKSSTLAIVSGLDSAGNQISGATFDDTMSIGQSTTIVLLITQGSTGYLPSAYSLSPIGSVTVKWAGGTAPTASTNAIDALTLTIIKTASRTFTVLGSATKYA